MIIKRIIFSIVLSFLLYSCINSVDGNGEVTNETRSVTAFNKIDISGGYEVLLNQGEGEQLEIEADENLMEYIESEVKNNTLFISTKKPIGYSKSLKLFITVVDVDDIEVSGAIQMKNKGTYKTDNLNISVSGAGNLNFDLETENLTIDMSGASETKLSGSSNNFDIEISGAGDLDAKKLKTRNTTVDISGAGSAIVFAKKTLKVDVSGAGSVKYKGNPKIDQDISGAGSIEKL